MCVYTVCMCMCVYTYICMCINDLFLIRLFFVVFCFNFPPISVISNGISCFLCCMITAQTHKHPLGWLVLRLSAEQQFLFLTNLNKTPSHSHWTWLDPKPAALALPMKLLEKQFSGFYPKPNGSGIRGNETQKSLFFKASR